MAWHMFVDDGNGKCAHTFRTGVKCGYKESAKSQHIKAVDCDRQPPESWGKVNLPDEEAKDAS